MDPGNNTAIILQLSGQGSIHRLDVELTDGDRSSEPLGRPHDWSEDILDLEKIIEAVIVDVGQFSERAYTEVDMEPIYKSEPFSLTSVCDHSLLLQNCMV